MANLRCLVRTQNILIRIHTQKKRNFFYCINFMFLSNKGFLFSAQNQISIVHTQCVSQSLTKCQINMASIWNLLIQIHTNFILTNHLQNQHNIFCHLLNKWIWEKNTIIFPANNWKIVLTPFGVVCYTYTIYKWDSIRLNARAMEKKKVHHIQSLRVCNIQGMYVCLDFSWVLLVTQPTHTYTRANIVTSTCI